MGHARCGRASLRVLYMKLPVSSWTAAEAANLFFNCLKSHTSFSGHPRIEGIGQAIMQAAIFARFLSRPNGMCSPPRHQNAFPFTPLKSVLVSRPLAALFSNLHARALFPPRSVPNCKQTGLGQGGASTPPNSFNQESQNCPMQVRANDARRRCGVSEPAS